MLKLLEPKELKPVVANKSVLAMRVDNKAHLEYIYLGLMLKKYGRKMPAGDVFTRILQNINAEMRKYLVEEEGAWVSSSDKFMKKFVDINAPKKKKRRGRPKK
jgi:hypothetical protein